MHFLCDDEDYRAMPVQVFLRAIVFSILAFAVFALSFANYTFCNLTLKLCIRFLVFFSICYFVVFCAKYKSCLQQTIRMNFKAKMKSR